MQKEEKGNLAFYKTWRLPFKFMSKVGIKKSFNVGKGCSKDAMKIFLSLYIDYIFKGVLINIPYSLYLSENFRAGILR